MTAAVRTPWGAGLLLALCCGAGALVRGEGPAQESGEEASLGAVPSAYRRAARSVVRVRREGGRPRGDAPQRRILPALLPGSQGSGVILGPQRVLTHAGLALYEDARYVVTTATGQRVDADLAALDLERGVALLETRAPLDAPAARTAPSGALAVGTPLLAVGDPFAMAHDGRAAVSLGILEGRCVLDAPGETYPGEVLLTDAAINPGSEGGALVDLRGRVVGLLCPLAFDRRLQPADEGASPHERPLLGYALPVEVALAVARPRRPDAPRLGFAGRAEAGGLRVVSVEPGGPAARAGLRPGDLIREAGGVPLRRGDVLRRLAARARGTVLELTLEREGTALRVRLDLAAEGPR
ncbi:MAG: serine protease [Planctomycetota bacterium]|nr:MAG: serine protease [Planctomycetota bacterium]